MAGGVIPRFIPPVILPSQLPLLLPWVHSNPFHCKGDALADADAHRAQRSPSPGALQLIHGGGGEPRAAHSERVTERNGTALWVDVRGIVSDPKLPQDGERLGGESLVELDQIEI